MVLSLSLLQRFVLSSRHLSDTRVIYVCESVFLTGLDEGLSQILRV